MADKYPNVIPEIRLNNKIFYPQKQQKKKDELKELKYRYF